jgi:hypothetical protein
LLAKGERITGTKAEVMGSKWKLSTLLNPSSPSPISLELSFKKKKKTSKQTNKKNPKKHWLSD